MNPRLALLAPLFWLAACHAPAPAPAPAAPPAVVQVATAQSRSLPVGLTAQGSFAADESAGVAPETDGIVLSTAVRAGDFVQAGAELLRLQPAVARHRLDQALAAEAQALAALRQAEAKTGGNPHQPEHSAEVQAAQANLDAAKADLLLAQLEDDRAAALLRSGDVSRSASDRAHAAALNARARVEAASQQLRAALNAARQDSGAVSAAHANLDAARAQLALARKALADTVVRAPFAGFVSARLAAPGEAVSPQSKVVTLDRLAPIRLLLQLAESDLPVAKPGLPVKAAVAAFPGRIFTGSIAAVHPALNPASRSATVEARFPNPSAELRPGMFGSATIESGTLRPVVAVPASALHEDPRVESRRVWVLQDGRARLRLVATVPSPDPLFALVSSGLQPGELVITSGAANLFDGAPVRR